MNPSSIVHTVGEVARLCACCPKTVVNWCKAGVLESYTIPGSQDRRVTHAALMRFLRANGMLSPPMAPSVLLVGLEARLTGRLAEALANDLCRLSFARGAFDAGLLCANERFDAVVIDHAIGRDLADDIVRGLGRLEPCRDTPAVALVPEDGLDTMSLVESDYAEVMLQPVDPALLAGTLRRLTTPRRRRRRG